MQPSGNPVLHRVRASNQSEDNNDVDDSNCATTSLPVNARPKHQSALVETQMHNIKSFPKYRRMNTEMMQWFKAEYPQMYNECVYELTEDDKRDPTWHYHSTAYDFRYDRVHPEWVTIFFA